MNRPGFHRARGLQRIAAFQHSSVCERRTTICVVRIRTDADGALGSSADMSQGERRTGAASGTLPYSNGFIGVSPRLNPRNRLQLVSGHKLNQRAIRNETEGTPGGPLPKRKACPATGQASRSLRLEEDLSSSTVYWSVRGQWASIYHSARAPAIGRPSGFYSFSGVWRGIGTIT